MSRTAAQISNRAEAQFAATLEARALEYIHLPYPWFPLPDGTMYRPDFFVPSTGVYFEVLGTVHRSRRLAPKLTLFRATYPGVPFEIIDLTARERANRRPGSERKQRASRENGRLGGRPRGPHGGPRRAHCPRGHDYTPANASIDKTGVQHCRHCDRERRRQSGARTRGALNAAKTHCPAGHAYTSDNTHVCPDGSRRCRVCARSARARYRRKHPSPPRRTAMNTNIEREFPCGCTATVEGRDVVLSFTPRCPDMRRLVATYPRPPIVAVRAHFSC